MYFTCCLHLFEGAANVPYGWPPVPAPKDKTSTQSPPQKREKCFGSRKHNIYGLSPYLFGHERGPRGSPRAMLSQDRATASRKFLLNTSPAFLMTFLVPERQNIFNIIEIKLPCALKISLTPPFLLADGGLMWYTSVAMYATHLM